MVKVSVVLSSVLLATGVAHAGPPGKTLPDDEYVAREVHRDRHRVGGTLGMWTPIGELGVNYTYLTRRVEIDVGVGYAFSGPQAAVMPRFRFGDDGLSLTLGAGLSVGRYKDGEACASFDGCDPIPETVAVWSNVEAGLVITTDTGTFVRIFGGGGQIVADTGCDAAPEDCEGLESALPYFGITVGKAF
jgi:hypothetical protein